MPRHLARHLRLRPGRRLGSAAEGVGVAVAVPLAVADVLELQLEDPHTQGPHRVELLRQRLHIVVRRHAHRLAGGDGPAERHMLGAGPLGQRPEVGAPVGGIRVAPTGLPVRVVARRVQVPVLLRTPHEVDLRQPLRTGPRLPVEALGHPAYGGARPVPDGDPGDALVPDQLTQCLHAVEETVLADAVHGDGVPARDPAHRDPVATGRQIVAVGGVQRAQGVLGAVAAEPDDGSAARQRLVDGPHARVPQDLPECVDGVRIRVRAYHEGDLGGERYGGPGCLDGLGPRPYGGQRAGCPCGRRWRRRGSRAPKGPRRRPAVPAESSPPSTATATAVACFLRLSRIALLPRSCRWAPSPPSARESVNAGGCCAVNARCGEWGEGWSAVDGRRQG